MTEPIQAIASPVQALAEEVEDGRMPPAEALVALRRVKARVLATAAFVSRTEEWMERLDGTGRHEATRDDGDHVLSVGTA